MEAIYRGSDQDYDFGEACSGTVLVNSILFISSFN